MPVSAETYERVALEDPEGTWELDCGRLRSKPAMTFAHNQLMHELGFLIRSQLDRSAFSVRINSGRAARAAATYFVPDVMVIPAALTARLRRQPDALEVYTQPLPLVVEVWSPSTGEYDVEAKLPEYQRRGDAEVWRLHPVERTLTAWRRQPDGSYAEMHYTTGVVQAAALPGVSVDLDALFRSIGG